MQEICKKDTIKDKECDDFSLLEQKQELQVVVKQNNQRTGRMSMEKKRCQVCDGPVVNGRCKLCGMPYRNDETLYHLNENRSDHYRHATSRARAIMRQEESSWEIRRLEVLHIRPGPEQAWQEPEINMIRKREHEALSHWLVQAQGILIIREM